MNSETTIKRADAGSPEARLMMDALWNEIQSRYGFRAPNPIDAGSFSVARAGFWIAWQGDTPVGSIALVPLSATETELDVMYVDPLWRGKGVASQLMQTAERYAKESGFHVIKLRAGEPQPEALRFYEKEGFRRIPVFGRWVFDETAVCLAKKIDDK